MARLAKIIFVFIFNIKQSITWPLLSIRYIITNRITTSQPATAFTHLFACVCVWFILRSFELNPINIKHFASKYTYILGVSYWKHTYRYDFVCDYLI